MPSIEKLGQRYNNNDLKILLINLKEDKELVTSFMSKNNYSSTVLLDVDGNVAEKYSVYGIPVSYLIDKQGQVAFQSPGFLDWSSSKMTSLVESLLND